MKPKRIVGVILLLTTLILIILMSAKFPNVKTRKFPLNNPVEVLSGPNNFYNLTLEPLGKEDYHLEITISPFNSPIQIDFWAVNETWLGPLINFTDLIPFFREIGVPWDYPNGDPFNLIKTYAKEINITGSRKFELSGLDYNGTYCLVLVNLFESTQYVVVNIEERFVEPPSYPVIEPNPTSLTISVAITMGGTYLVITGSKRSAKR